MYLLQWIFRLLVVCGCWRPLSWSSPFKKFLYTVYMVIVLLLIYSVTFCQFMDILINVNNRDEFSDNFYMFLAMLISCHKFYNLVKIREKIVAYLDILKRKPFLPENQEENVIRARSDKRAQFITLLYTLLVESTVVVIIIVGLSNYESRKLPMRSWIPYNYSAPLPYSLAYIQQSLALTAGSLVQVSCDSLLCGFLIHTCSQIEILSYRLKSIKTHENQLAKSCARFHEYVYRFASMINKEFNMIIFVQFAVSTLVVCFSLYMLTETKDSRIFSIVMFTCCMLTQIFFYCWFGNEVKLKSLEISNVIFGTDWMLLDNNVKRVLLMIMKRARVPIEFNSVHIISMNVDSFVNILKTAYSAYNLLQQGQG